MQKKLKCVYCNIKTAKRYCPALDILICPTCCAVNRSRNISCPDDCRYMDNEIYQQKIREEKELKALLEKIPSSEDNDIYKDKNAAMVAYQFEAFFADCYIKGFFNLTDQKVRETLKNLYYMKFKGKIIEPDEFMQLVL